MRGLAFLAAALATAIGSPALAAEELRLAPTTVWAVNYADENCELAREFGEGDEKVTLSLFSDQPGGRFTIDLSGNPVRVSERVVNPFVNLGDVEQLTPAFLSAALPDGTPALVGVPLLSVGPVPNPRENVPRVGLPGVLVVDPANEAAMTYLAVRNAVERDFVLDTGSMAEPLAALRACSEDLVSHWGVDVDAHRSLTRRATPRQSSMPWIRPPDYPAGVARNGLVRFRLMVNERGRVDDCIVQGATHPPEFATSACARLRQRARFDPALDAQGEPIASYFVGSVFYSLPNR